MVQPPENPTPHPAKRRPGVIILGSVAGLAIGLAVVAAVYGITGSRRNPDAAACAGAVKTAKRLAPLMQGEVAALNPATRPLRVPNLAFQGPDGAAQTLADWRGKTVLLNLWATWCVPCRKEMPTLDALQAKLGGPDFAVVAVNIDTRDPAKPKAFLKQIGVSHLSYHADPSAKVFQELKAIGKAFGMPTTLLVDAKGCELGTMAGPAEWSSNDATKLIQAAIKARS